ncbi:metal cation symporter ZIP14-like [Glandiceps talaboti]
MCTMIAPLLILCLVQAADQASVDVKVDNFQLSLKNSSLLPLPEVFLDDLDNELGTNDKLSLQQLEQLLERLRHNGGNTDGIAIRDGVVTVNSEQDRCYSAVEMMQTVRQIGRRYCAEEGNEDQNEVLEFEEFWSRRVRRSSSNDTEPEDSPTTAEKWGYGFLCVTIISCCSLVGVLVVPFMFKKVFKYVLMFLICLAVGSLSGCAILHLLSKAHQFEDVSLTYHLKNLTILGGIYLFFVVEKLIKMALAGRNQQTLQTEMAAHANEGFSKGNDDVNEMVVNGGPKACSHAEKGKGLATVAYMVIMGDGLHNFMDGLAIGTGFTISVISGVSISVAIFCEEFPHELGDFAILLNSGMPVKKALLFNFLSACMCYLGLVVGIFLGEYTDASTWIFALTCGIFLYIALVDMLPEINTVEEGDINWGTQWLLFFLQSLGLLVGWGIMFLLAIYEDDMKKV